MAAGQAAAVVINPLPDLLNIGGTVVQGNLGALSQAIGKAVIDSCFVCGATANVVVSPSDRAFIEAIVGRGFIEFVTTEDPFVVVADAATSIALRTQIGRQESPIPSAPIPRVTMAPARVFTVTPADCLVVSDTGTVAAGWISSPKLTVKATGTNYTYPNIQFQPNDILELTSTNAGCGVPSSGLTHQKYVTQLRVTYTSDSSRSGTPTQMKNFIVAKLAS